MDHKYYYRDHSGQRATGIGLAAGLGAGALFLGIAGLWGLNQASKARSAGAYAGIAANSAALNALHNTVNDHHNAADIAMANERYARETWQERNAPSIQSYIDINNRPYVNTNAMSNAEAFALASAINNNGINSAIGTDSFLKVQRYSAPQPCGCDGCGCNG